MDSHTVIHFKKDCISCGACAAISPELWEMDEQGLAQLRGSKEVGDHWEKVITTIDEKAAHDDAASVCPVNIIHVKKMEKEIEKTA
ncbi:MAG: ferredoxin [Nanoarchaeota archaeon]